MRAVCVANIRCFDPGVSSLFIRVMLDKKYALPYRVRRSSMLVISPEKAGVIAEESTLRGFASVQVLDGLVEHFTRTAAGATDLVCRLLSLHVLHDRSLPVASPNMPSLLLVTPSRAEPRHEGMPVLWHQSLLTFVQRYKTELTHEDREKLKVRPHLNPLQHTKCQY